MFKKRKIGKKKRISEQASEKDNKNQDIRKDVTKRNSYSDDEDGKNSLFHYIFINFILIQKLSLINKANAGTKRIRGLDTAKIHADKKNKSLNDTKFTEVVNLNIETEKPKEAEEGEKAQKKSKIPEQFKNLFKLPEELDYANYNENREVIDRKHWLEGLAQIDIDTKNGGTKGPTVNDVAKALNREAIADLNQPKK